jgi:Rrf2 family cysteine metabolism transcriptional repressor
VRISARGEYAIKAVLDLALQYGRGLVPIQDIAARQGIPARYLEQVLLGLKHAGLLTSKRGTAGGYLLARAPEDITVGEVLRAVEVPSGPSAGATDPLVELWEEVAEAVSHVVDRLTIGELAVRVAERRRADRVMYHI